MTNAYHLFILFFAWKHISNMPRYWHISCASYDVSHHKPIISFHCTAFFLRQRIFIMVLCGFVRMHSESVIKSILHYQFHFYSFGPVIIRITCRYVLYWVYRGKMWVYSRLGRILKIYSAWIIKTVEICVVSMYAIYMLRMQLNSKRSTDRLNDFWLNEFS